MYEDLFLILALFNTNISLQNEKKNTDQLERQKRIESKIDKIISFIEKEENNNE